MSFPANAAITAQNDLESPLLKLPPELRNRIYHYAVVSSNPIYLPPRYPSLMLTCRKLYNEAKSIYYEDNTFYFSNASITPAFVNHCRRCAGPSANKMSTANVMKHIRTGDGRFCWFRLQIGIGEDRSLEVEMLSTKIWNDNGYGYGSCDGQELCLCEFTRMAKACETAISPFFDLLEKYARMVRAPGNMLARLCNVCGLTWRCEYN